MLLVIIQTNFCNIVISLFKINPWNIEIIIQINSCNVEMIIQINSWNIEIIIQINSWNIEIIIQINFWNIGIIVLFSIPLFNVALFSIMLFNVALVSRTVKINNYYKCFIFEKYPSLYMLDIFFSIGGYWWWWGSQKISTHVLLFPWG